MLSRLIKCTVLCLAGLLTDLQTLAGAWLRAESDLNWNAVCGLSSPTDGKIDLEDFVIFSQFWE